MKNAMMVAVLSLMSLGAFAQENSTSLNQMTTEVFAYGIDCSDPRTMGRYNTREEAELGCPKFDNVYVSYDYFYHKYVCDCTGGNGGNGGNH